MSSADMLPSVADQGEELMLMPGLMIDREILIEAPIEVVWRTITEPDQVTQWFADRVELVIEPGAHGYMGFGDQGGPVVVEVVDPPTRFSFRWNHPDGEEPVAGNSMLVEFTLTPAGDERTRLRVVETGHELRDWPDAEKQRYADEHQGGWAEYLDRLASVLAKRQPGWPRRRRRSCGRPPVPRPAAGCSTFWSATARSAPAGWPGRCRSPARRSPST